MAKVKPETRIKNEKDRLLCLFKGCDPIKISFADGLLDAAAFMRITLDDLSIEIMRNGTTENYNNGQHQSGCKPSAAISAFNLTVKNYSAVMKQLFSMFPEKKEAAQTEKPRMNQLMMLLEKSREAKRTEVPS